MTRGEISMFDVKMRALRKKQNLIILQLGRKVRVADRRRLQQYRHKCDVQIDVLARSLLDALSTTEVDTEFAAILVDIIEATCLPLHEHETIRKAVDGAFELVAVMESEEYIRDFTGSGKHGSRFTLIADSIEIIKSWILVTEATLDRMRPNPRPNIMKPATRRIANRMMLELIKRKRPDSKA